MCFIIIYFEKPVVLLNVFVKTMISGFLDWQSSKEQHLLDFLCNNVNIFTVTIDQFNESLLNKSIVLVLIPNF